jgi:hypothetical protein
LALAWLVPLGLLALVTWGVTTLPTANTWLLRGILWGSAVLAALAGFAYGRAVRSRRAAQSRPGGPPWLPAALAVASMVGLLLGKAAAGASDEANLLFIAVGANVVLFTLSFPLGRWDWAARPS